MRMLKWLCQKPKPAFDLGTIRDVPDMEHQRVYRLFACNCARHAAEKSGNYDQFAWPLKIGRDYADGKASTGLLKSAFEKLPTTCYSLDAVWSELVSTVRFALNCELDSVHCASGAATHANLTARLGKWKDERCWQHKEWARLVEESGLEFIFPKPPYWPFGWWHNLDDLPRSAAIDTRLSDLVDDINRFSEHKELGLEYEYSSDEYYAYWKINDCVLRAIELPPQNGRPHARLVLDVPDGCSISYEAGKAYIKLLEHFKEDRLYSYRGEAGRDLSLVFWVFGIVPFNG